MLEIYGIEVDNKTLEELKIYSSRDYAIEIKKEQEVFSVYNEEDIYIRVIPFTTKYSVFEEEFLPATNIQIKKTAPFKEFLDVKIKEAFKIDTSFEKIRLLVKKKGVTLQETRFESLLQPENMAKSIKDLWLYDGCAVYLETIENDEDMKKSKWIKYLEEEKLKIIIMFNNPLETDPNSVVGEYKYQIEVTKNFQLQEVKRLIGTKLQIDSNKIILKRGGKNSPEIKDLYATLGSIGIPRNATFYVELGSPSKPDEHKLIISEANISKNNDDDSEIFDFVDYCEIIVTGDMTIFQIKDIICQKIINDKGLNIAASRIRLWERYGQILRKVLIDSLEIKSYGIYDNKTLTFQLLDYEEVFDPNDLVVYARSWDPSTWSLSEIKELIVKKSWRMHDMSYYICDKFPEYRNKIDTIYVGKIRSIINFKRGDLLGISV